MVRSVLAWDDDGQPLVLGENCLVLAWQHDGFDRLRNDNSTTVGAIPGGGWLIDCADEQGNTWTTPILAWVVHGDGTATPITTDRDGVTGDATEGLAEYRIYHPDEREAE